mgnify:FL=1
MLERADLFPFIHLLYSLPHLLCPCRRSPVPLSPSVAPHLLLRPTAPPTIPSTPHRTALHPISRAPTASATPSRSQADGIIIVKTKQAVLVAEYANPTLPGEATKIVEVRPRPLREERDGADAEPRIWRIT